MIKFLFGAVFGIIIGAAAAVYLSMQGGMGHAYVQAPAPEPGRAVIHLSIDQAYLNQQLINTLAGQPEFKGLQPTLATQAPNIVIVTAEVEVTVGNNKIKVRPTVTMQVYVEAGRIRTRVAGVNIGDLSVPATLVQTQIDQIERVTEEQANGLAAAGLAGTGLKIISVSASNTGLLVDLGP
jgi:hypothetical protein